MKAYHVIGLMSGTSMDGLDIAFCKFILDSNQWTYEIVQAETLAYSKEWKQRLSSAESSLDLVQTHYDYGYYIGKTVKLFIEKHNIKVDFVSSHGHTLFHQPSKRITFQLGHGAAIAAECHLPVVCDFRSLDVALGGQGAPLVPIGDQFLFPAYDFCLNLGGFANVSFEKDKERIAFDICPVNIMLNELAKKMGKEFDENGQEGRKGNVSLDLLNELNQLEFYAPQRQGPKSLGKEWLIEHFSPIVNKYPLSLQDQFSTIYEHVAMQIALAIKREKPGRILITGGGAHNSFLIERISALTNHQPIIPDKRTVDFKEALIFAFLGILKLRGEINCLKSVTGATRDNSGGVIYN